MFLGRCKLIFKVFTGWSAMSMPKIFFHRPRTNYENSQEFKEIQKISNQIRDIKRQTAMIKAGKLTDDIRSLTYDENANNGNGSYSLKKLNII